MKIPFKSGVKVGVALTLCATSGAFAQDFCSNAQHSGQKVTITSNQTGKIGDIGYELWDENGHGGSATFYSDGSMDCTITGAKDYLCRAGLSLGSNKTYKELGGDMIAEFKLVKSGASNVGYSYIGIYGWMEQVSGAPSNLVEYYVIDNTLANDMPGSWIGNERKGTITVDGGTYTVYRNTRTGPAIKTSGNVQFYQYFSVRDKPRDCGTINISEHMRQWEKMGMTMGKLYEAKVLGEAGNVNGQVNGGHMDFPHAKVYISNGDTPKSSASVAKSSSSTAVAKSSSSNGGSNVSGTIDACKDKMGHEGSSKTTQGQNNSSVTGNVGSSPYHYEIWYQGGNNSMTFYDNGTYKASWNGTNDFLARVGFKYNEDKSYSDLGPIDAYFNWSKQGSAGGYNYIGIGLVDEFLVAEDDVHGKGTVTKTPAQMVALNAVATKKGTTLTWTKAAKASSYEVYQKKEGAASFKKIKTISDPEKNSLKIAKKKLKKKAGYVYYVKVLGQDLNGEPVEMDSWEALVFPADGKYTNVKKLSLTADVGASFTMASGETKGLDAKVTKVKKSKKLPKTYAPIRYSSSDESIATVDENGQVTAKAGGSCFIYAFGTNGVFQSVGVTVK